VRSYSETSFLFREWWLLEAATKIVGEISYRESTPPYLLTRCHGVARIVEQVLASHEGVQALHDLASDVSLVTKVLLAG